MYPYMNEDAAWQRLRDIQREIENSRLMAAGQPHATFATLKRLAARVWLLGGLASMRPPRRRSVLTQRDGDHRSEVA